ncbi:MAG: site-specific DNA-methyltransferase [Rhodocyclaceae bacterium]|nr:site-specific DNA-methyltransferase [Rhodocyclaceae bacterium]
MQKIEAISPEAQSADIVAGNIAQLKALFPELVSEGAGGITTVNVDILKELVGDKTVTDVDEKYGLNWHGKRKARQLALTPSTGTLRPCPEESVDWEATQNLMIEGDNLEVLKLLQKSYGNNGGQVKLIYIDPPYNTGKDFVYPDNFQDNIKNYLELTGQVEGGAKITTNTEASGRFHTDWLNMMYPRLRLAKSLLHPQGAIMVSCDDNELPRLILLLDEVFGEENFVGQIVWQRSKKGDAKLIATTHEYIVCYVKDKGAVLEQGVWRRPKEGADEVLAKYQELKTSLSGNHEAIRTAMMDWYRSLPEGDPKKSHKHYNWSDDRGLYFAADFAGPDDGRESRPRHDIFHPVTNQPCKKPSTGWRWDEEKTNWALAQTPPRIHFGPDETTIPTRKSYLFEIDREPYSSVFYRDGRSATLEVEDLVGKGWFQFPKNTDVLSELIELITKPDDIILDFFAGSGSTGHAVMKVNSAHQTKRRFILVQLPEPTGKEPYKSICDITKQRLRKAGDKIATSAGLMKPDLGFRVFKLETSNIRAWNPKTNDLKTSLFDHLDHLEADRTSDDILYEILLKLGLDLCIPIEKREIAGKQVNSVGVGVLMACLNESIKMVEVEALALGMVAWREEQGTVGDTTTVFRDSAFENDVAKSNLAAILEQHGIKQVRSL